MKNMDFSAFKRLLFVDGNDIEFEYQDIQYTLNLMDMKICVNRQKGKQITFQYFAPAVSDWSSLIEAFLKAPLFDGHSLIEIEKDITVTFTAFNPD